MFKFLIYITESALCMSVLLIFYRYLYFKIADFDRSRFYLLISLGISLVMPLLPIPQSFIPVAEKAEFIYTNSAVIQYVKVSEGKSLPNKIHLPEILFIIWVSGFIPYLFLFFRNIIKIKKLAKKHTKIKTGQYNIINTESNIPCFSYFNNIYTGTKFNLLNSEAQAKIIEHEKLHARMLHSIDRLILEFYRTVFWFNPFTKILLLSIKEVHEFSVDKKLTDNNFSEDYSRLLLSLASGNLLYPSANNFSENNQLKDRIELIANPESDKIRKIRFWVSVPVLLFTIFALWLAVTTANSFTTQNENNGKYIEPVKSSDYSAKLPFFRNRLPGKNSANKNNTSKMRISHLQTDYKTNSNVEILSASVGIVQSIDTNDIQGLKEISITIKSPESYEFIYAKLAHIKVTNNDKLIKGQVIGLTGDSSLYPIFTFKVMKDGKFLNPHDIIMK